MSYDWSGTGAPTQPTPQGEPNSFPFWSRGEVMRVGVIVALAAIPFSLSPSRGSAVAVTSVARASTSPAPAGYLRAVRVMPFDLKALTPSGLADAD